MGTAGLCSPLLYTSPASSYQVPAITETQRDVFKIVKKQHSRFKNDACGSRKLKPRSPQRKFRERQSTDLCATVPDNNNNNNYSLVLLLLYYYSTTVPLTAGRARRRRAASVRDWLAATINIIIVLLFSSSEDVATQYTIYAVYTRYIPRSANLPRARTYTRETRFEPGTRCMVSIFPCTVSRVCAYKLLLLSLQKTSARGRWPRLSLVSLSFSPLARSLSSTTTKRLIDDDDNT